MYNIFLFKGEISVPSLVVVPNILPHIAPYNHYITHIYVVYVGIYISRVLSQGYPTFHLISPPIDVAPVAPVDSDGDKTTPAADS